MAGLANNTNNNVGDVTATMGFRNFDDKTKPFEREDLSDYILSGRMLPEEKALVDKALYTFFGGCALTFGATYALAGRLPWRKLNKEIGFNLTRFGRISMGLSTLVFPYVYVQQTFIEEVGNLPMSYPLSFHIRRMLITQRGAIMFGRSTLREVTKEEQKAYERVAVQIQRENTNQLMGSNVDVNAELQKQVMLPIAQSGYKPMPKQ